MSYRWMFIESFCWCQRAFVFTRISVFLINILSIIVYTICQISYSSWYCFPWPSWRHIGLSSRKCRGWACEYNNSEDNSLVFTFFLLILLHPAWPPNNFVIVFIFFACLLASLMVSDHLWCTKEHWLTLAVKKNLMVLMSLMPLLQRKNLLERSWTILLNYWIIKLFYSSWSLFFIYESFFSIYN